MAGNSTPIFSRIGKITWAQVTGTDGSQDGTDADVQLVFTADATNGSFAHKICCQPRSASGSVSFPAGAVRVYLNNGSTNGTAANNSLMREISIPATTVNVAATTGTPAYEIPLNIQLPAGYRLYVGYSNSVANGVLQVTVYGGDY
jgi:hypothetical protein